MYDETAKEPRVKEISDSLCRLEEYVSVLGKACENLSNQIEPVLAPQVPESSKAEVAQEARSQVGRQLQEICYKVGLYTKHLNDMADRVEL